MKVLILAGGQSDFNSADGNYPVCLTEIDGAPLIQHLIKRCAPLGNVGYVVALREQDIRQYHLDNVISILEPTTKIVSIKSNTRGAACTALFSLEHINEDDELLVINANEILDEDFPSIVANFRGRKLDAGVVTFPSIHPRYSYVKLNPEDLVVEAAEKKPISRHATVGFYWFSHGGKFMDAIKKMICKDASINNIFYICPALNEMILQQAKIGVFPIDPSKYRPLKTARQLMQADAAPE